MGWVLGIDPGLDGALALLNPAGVVSEVWDTPTSTAKSSKGTKRVLLEQSAADIVRWSCDLVKFEQLVVAIERVTAMPAYGGDGERRSMGAASAFNMGVGWGLWRGICVGMRVPYLLVSPVSWKKHFSIPGKQAGGDSRVVAQRLFPTVPLNRAKDHGRADALLIAKFALDGWKGE